MSQRSSEEFADGSVHLSQDDRQLLEKGKEEHRQTTETARRALQVAERTNDVARTTLVEMHRQGEQLARAEIGMDQVGREVKEASAIIRFMRRWCCFQCPCCWDPTRDQDATRKSRVENYKKALAFEQENVGLQYAAKQQAVDRQARQHDTAYGGGGEAAARHELLAAAGPIKAARQAPDIGYGLPEEDRQEIKQETVQQEELIGKIGDAVQSLHALSKEMQSEMTEQAPRIDRLQDRTAAAHDQLGQLTREARRV